MIPSVLIIFFPVFSGQCSGSSVFLQTGRDSTLDVNESISLKTGDDFLWKHNTKNIIKYNGQQIFNFGGVKFIEENFSLHLNNVKANASGTYTAVVIGQTDRIVAEYHVKVLGESLIISKCDTQQYAVVKTVSPGFFTPLPQTQ